MFSWWRYNCGLRLKFGSVDTPLGVRFSQVVEVIVNMIVKAIKWCNWIPFKHLSPAHAYSWISWIITNVFFGSKVVNNIFVSVCTWSFWWSDNVLLMKIQFTFSETITSIINCTVRILYICKGNINIGIYLKFIGQYSWSHLSLDGFYDWMSAVGSIPHLPLFLFFRV